MPSVPSLRTVLPADQLAFNSTTMLLRNKHNPMGSLSTTNVTNSGVGMGEMTQAVQTWYPTPRSLVDPAANLSAWALATQVFQADFCRARRVPTRDCGARVERQ